MNDQQIRYYLSTKQLVTYKDKKLIIGQIPYGCTIFNSFKDVKTPLIEYLESIVKSLKNLDDEKMEDISNIDIHLNVSQWIN